MRKILLVLVIGILFSLVSNAQEKRISLYAGYPINLTKHWNIKDWENSLCLGLKYAHVNNLWIYGGGLYYETYDIVWSKYYNSEKNRISNLTPHINFGLNINNGLLYAIPTIDLGYSFIHTNIDTYEGKIGGIYSGFGIDFKVNITEKLMLGFGTNYNVIFNKLDFFAEGSYPNDIIPIEGENLKSLLLNLNFAYRFY